MSTSQDTEATVILRRPPRTRLASFGQPGVGDATRLFDPATILIRPKPDFDSPTVVLPRTPHWGEDEPLANGSRLKDRYEVLRTIGRGGFSYVYLCQDLHNGGLHAIKEAFPSDGVRSSTGELSGDQTSIRYCRDAILREMIVIARASHPGIVRLDDAFEENNTLCFSMQFVEGESLANLLKRRGALSYETIASIGGSIIDAMDHLHNLDVLHGDIKPGNVLLRPNKSTVLIDFGSAQRLSDISYEAMAVSAGYSPAERYYVHGPIGPWSDIYGCAAVLAAMLTGKDLPPVSEMPADRMDWLERFIPRPARSKAETKLLTGVASGLAHDARERPQSAAEFLQSLGLAKPDNVSAVTRKLETSGSIFISYSRQDAARVEEIVKALQLRGIGVWIDRQDIAPGEAWGGEIMRGLRAAEMVLVFSSENSMKSRHVRREVYAAENLKKKIVAVLLDEAPFHDEIALFLTEAQNVRLAKFTPTEFAKIAADMLDRLI